MTRRDKTGGKSVKRQHRQTVRPRNTAKVARRRKPYAVDANEKVALLEQNLNEALEQQTAMSEILGVISNSSTDLAPVFSAILANATRLCEGNLAALWRYDGKFLIGAAQYNASAAFVDKYMGTKMEPSRAGPARLAALERRTVHVADITTEPGFSPLVLQYERARSVLAVPLLREENLIGVIAIWRREVRPFTDKQIDLVRNFAKQAVIAIENARLLNELRQRTTDLSEALEQQTATSEVLQVISSSSGDLEPVFGAMLENAVRICDAEFGNIYRWDADALHLVASHNTPTAYAEHRRRLPLRFDQMPESLRRMVGTKAPIQVDDIRTLLDGDEKRNPEVVAGTEIGGIRTVLNVPMLKEGNLVGAFIVSSQEVRPFTDKQIELVQNFAAQAVIAIENTRLLNELRERTTDLTEALEQQTAASQVLQVISSSPGELEPVFQAMLENATRICEAKFGVLYRYDDAGFEPAALSNAPPAYANFVWSRGQFFPQTGNGLDRLLHTKAVIHTMDEAAEPVPTNSARFAGARSQVLVPMLKEGRLAGAIAIYRQEVRPFTDKQIELVKNFAAQAVIAIENARLLNELRQSLEQQTATSKVLDVISRSAFDVKVVFETVAESSVKLCGAERALIFRFDGEVLKAAASFKVSQEHREFVEQHPFPPGRNTGSARAALEHRTIQIADVSTDPEHSYGVTTIDPIRTVLSVPILKGDDLLGVITIFHLVVRPFTPQQIALVETFADQAAIAIENARLLDELRQRTDELGRSLGELRALGEVSQAVNSTLDLETVLTTIVSRAVQLSRTDAGAIYVFDDERQEFRLHATYGMSETMIAAITDQRIGLGDALGAATAQRKPIQVPDIRNEPTSPVNEIIVREGYRGILVIPLLRPGQIVGALVVRRKTPGEFANATIDLLQTFADQSVVAIQNARLFESVEARTRELGASLEDLQTTQDRLVQTQKLASLGQLTAGIAHEIKNPLNFVNNFSGVSTELIDELQEALGKVKADTSTLAEITELTNTLRGNLDKIVQHGKRADAIVKNMLLHSRERSGEHRSVDANALVEESLNLAYHGARAENQGFKINIEKSFDPTAGQVDVYPQEITRGLLNLISNGFYAAIKRKEQDNSHEPSLTAATKDLGEKVEIRIRDNGSGVPPEVRDKMFNPFFTTKPAGAGTGLGLSITHDIIVKQHSGSIEVGTQPGEFTEVRIVLPRKAAFTA